MNVPHTGPPVGPPHGAVLITRVAGPPLRYQLSLFPSRPGIEVGSAKAAWSMARGFAATQGVEIWYTGDGEAPAHAPEVPPGMGPKERRRSHPFDVTPGS